MISSYAILFIRTSVDIETLVGSAEAHMHTKNMHYLKYENTVAGHQLGVHSYNQVCIRRIRWFVEDDWTPWGRP